LSTKTNFDKYKEDLLSNPENINKYNIAREKIKLEMMLETLRTQVIEDRNRSAILGQITKISNRVENIFIL
jgi:hypothetical protein